MAYGDPNRAFEYLMSGVPLTGAGGAGGADGGAHGGDPYGDDDYGDEGGDPS